MKHSLAQADSLAALASLVVWGGLLLVHLRRRRGASRPPVHAADVALLLLGLSVRLALPPAFVHSNLHGYEILDDIVDFPRPSLGRAYFGQGSFVLLGLAVDLFGASFRTVVVANVLAGVATVALASELVRRAFGGPAARVVLALGAVAPALVRGAASEDAHNVGLLFAMLALVLADGARRERDFSLARLGLIGASTVIAMHCRHVFAVWPLVVLGAVLPQEGWRAVLTGRAMTVTWLGSLLLWASRGVGMLTSEGDRATYRAMGILLRALGDPSFQLRHPLLRPDESLLFTPLLLLGLVAAARRRDRVTTLAGVLFVLLFAITLPFSLHPSYGEEYAFRLPLFGVALLLTGAGAAGLIRGPRSAAALALGALALPIPGLLRVAADVDPQWQEYRIIADHGGSKGASYATVKLGQRTEPPSWKAPRAAFASSGATIETVRPSELPPDATVYVGIGCSAYNLFDFGGYGSISKALDALDGLGSRGLRDLSDAFWDAPEEAIAMFGSEPPVGLRPECQPPEGAEWEEWGRVVVHRQQQPHAWFSSTEIPVGVWRASAPSMRSER